MKNTFDDVVKALNELIETNIDRTKGYETAAGDAEDPDVKKMCNEHALQSRTFKGALERLVREYGGTPQEHSSASGTVYRAWMEVKHAATGHDKKSVLSSCEFGEDAAKKSYEGVIEDSAGFPDNVITEIKNQQGEILKAHDQVKAWRDVLVEH